MASFMLDNVGNMIERATLLPNQTHELTALGTGMLEAYQATLHIYTINYFQYLAA